jgi:hypothetical protein
MLLVIWRWMSITCCKQLWFKCKSYGGENVLNVENAIDKQKGRLIMKMATLGFLLFERWQSDHLTPGGSSNFLQKKIPNFIMTLSQGPLTIFCHQRWQKSLIGGEKEGEDRVTLWITLLTMHLIPKILAGQKVQNLKLISWISNFKINK